MPKHFLKPFFSKVIITISILCVSLNVWADTPSQDLAKLLSGFNSLSAQFEQIVSGSRKKPKQVSYGSMALERPGKFRWEVTRPNAQLLLADGRYLWIYDIDLEQATRQKLDTDNASGFRLKPKGNSDMFQWIELYFVNNKLVSMRLFDNLGVLTNFHFSNVQLNPSLNSSLFKFKAPKNVEIIKN